MILNQKQKLFLEQKIQILEEELKQYREKQDKHKKLNQSILQSYKQNQNYRELRQSKLQKDLKQITLKQKQQIRKMKSQFNKDKAILQSQNKSLKQKVENLEIKRSLLQVQYQKNIQQTKKILLVKHEKNMKTIQDQLTSQIQELKGKLEQISSQNEMYKQYIQRKDALNKENVQISKNRREQRCYDLLSKYSPKYILSRRESCSNIRNYMISIKKENITNLIQEKNIYGKKLLKTSKQSLSQLNRRLSKAMSQLHENIKTQRT